VNLLPHVEGGPDGTAIGSFVLINDITRHRVAEQAARESEERLAKFMQASAEGIVFHKDGYITDVNPPICELIGYTHEEMLGRKTLEFIAPDHVAQVARGDRLRPGDGLRKHACWTRTANASRSSSSCAR